MATTTGTAPQRQDADPLYAPTLCEAFQLTAAAAGDRLALISAAKPWTRTWAEYAQTVRSLAGGLASLGIGSGDTVALLLSNRPEFHLVDTAALHLGAIPFSIYHTNPPGQIVPQLENADATVLVTEPMFIERARAVRASFPALTHLIVIEPDDELGPGELSLEQVDQLGAPDGFDFETTWRQVTPDHVATLVYTSGTTGAPKGVEHTHGGLLFGLQCLARLAPVSPAGRVVSYLPNAHIAERYISHYSSLAFGYTITGCPDPAALPAALRATRPTRLFGVPRIYEKLSAGANGLIAADETGELAAALEAGLARVRAEQAGEPVPALSEAHEAALLGLREKLGLDQLEWAGVAAAPSPYAMLEFVHALGVNVAELWGMSECVLSTSNPPARVKLGTVGIAIPGVEIKLGADGEILVRGPNVTRQYRKEPEKTAEAIDADGWLHSGDIAVADADGYLKIVDRKKELIINSAGKNMAPSKIEMAIKQESPLIAFVVAIGDARQYVTAIVALDEDAVNRARADAGLPEDIAGVAAHDWILEQIRGAVARGNEHLARVEQVKNVYVAPEYWLPGGDQVTPTSKVKRRVIDKLYAEQIDALYG